MGRNDRPSCVVADEKSLSTLKSSKKFLKFGYRKGDPLVGVGQVPGGNPLVAEEEAQHEAHHRRVSAEMADSHTALRDVELAKSA